MSDSSGEFGSENSETTIERRFRRWQVDFPTALTVAAPPPASISALRSFSGPSERDESTTWRPSFARRVAMARPIPREAPVTMATGLVIS